jgi:hypothetical protein
MWFNPESQVARLTSKFAQDKADIWADPDMPLEDKAPAIEELWREFNRQREEIRSSASQGEAVGEEPSPEPSRAAFLPRRRRPQWK